MFDTPALGRSRALLTENLDRPQRSSTLSPGTAHGINGLMCQLSGTTSRTIFMSNHVLPADRRAFGCAPLLKDFRPGLEVRSSRHYLLYDFLQRSAPSDSSDDCPSTSLRKQTARARHVSATYTCTEHRSAFGTDRGVSDDKRPSPAVQRIVLSTFFSVSLLTLPALMIYDAGIVCARVSLQDRRTR